MFPEEENRYYPKTLIYGLLAYDCASRSSFQKITTEEKSNNEADDTGIQVSQELIENIKENVTLDPILQPKIYLSLEAIKDQINITLKEWKILESISDRVSGYFGIIYVNESASQLILVHRSTDFSDSFSIQGQSHGSSLKEDIEGVVKAKITLYQAQAFIATEKSLAYVNLDPNSKYHGYSLSFAGHSLGAWLAQLSVYYCIDYFKYNHVKAVTFDGPGSYDIIKKISGANFNRELIDQHLVSYLSAPNIVNCANNHLGTIYRLFPCIQKKLEKKFQDWCVDVDFIKKLGEKIIKKTPSTVTSLYGHCLENILAYFDFISGEPYADMCVKIEKWPVIDFINFNKKSSSLKPDSLIDFFTSFIPKNMLITRFGINLVLKNINYNEIFNFENITFGAMLLFMNELYENVSDINLHQFWLIHEFSDKQSEFKLKSLNSIDRFYLDYDAQYREIDIDKYNLRKISSSQIDQCLLIIREQYERDSSFIQGKWLIELIEKVKIDRINGTISIENEHQVQDVIRKLLHRDPDFVTYVNNLHKTRIKAELFNHWINFEKDEISNVHEALKNKKVLILKGTIGSGKTELAKTYGKTNQVEFTTRMLNASSIEELEKSIKLCANAKSVINYQDKLDYIRITLSETKQRVLFILDNAKTESDVRNILQTFTSLSNVKLIITTRNDSLFEKNAESFECSEIILESNSYNREQLKQCFNQLNLKDKNILRLLSCLKQNKISYESFQKKFGQDLIDKNRKNSFLNKNKQGFLNLNKDECLRGIIFSHKFSDSLIDVIEFILSFDLNDILIDNIKNLFMLVDLELINHDIKKYINSLNYEKKIQFALILSQLLDNIGTNLQVDPQIKKKNFQILFDLKEELMSKEEFELEEAITELVKELENVGHRKLIDTKFVRIEFLIEKLNYFAETTREQLHFNDVELLNEYEHVIFIGPTSSGKSTLINYLLGHTLKCVKLGRNSNNSTIEIQNKQSNESLDSPKIGNNEFISETDKISRFIIHSRKQVYWDFPGFRDSRGVIKNVRNAYYLRKFSQCLSNFKILLVLDGPGLKAERGDGLIKTVQLLSQLCNVKKVKESLGLVLTKCDVYNEEDISANEKQISEDKQQFIDEFKTIYAIHSKEPYAEFLELLSSECMKNKMSFFTRPTKSGEIINKEHFVHLDESIANISNSKNVQFDLSLDDFVLNRLRKIHDLLSNYFRQIIDEKSIKTAKKHFLRIIKNLDFSKKELRDELNANHLNANETEIERLIELLGKFDGNENDSKILFKINNAYNFLNILLEQHDDKLSIKCSNSFEKYRTILKTCMMLCDKPNIDMYSEPNVIFIKAPFVFASEIKDIYGTPNLTVSYIVITALEFIMDTDLNLPSVSMAFYCEKWRILGSSKTISLKGNLNNPDSGSFYSNASVIDGGFLDVNLDGANGSNGNFNMENVKTNFENVSKDITKLQDNLKMITTFKGFAKSDPILKMLFEPNSFQWFNEKKKSYENKIKSIEQSLNDLNKNNISDSHLDKSNREKQKNLKIIKQKEEELNQYQKNLSLIDQIFDLVKVKHNYDREISTQDKEKRSFMNLNELKEAIQKFQSEINLLGDSEIETDDELKEFVNKIDSISNQIKTFKMNLKVSPDLTKMDSLRSYEREYNTKRKISLNEVDYILSANELDNIDEYIKVLTFELSEKENLKRDINEKEINENLTNFAILSTELTSLNANVKHLEKLIEKKLSASNAKNLGFNVCELCKNGLITLKNLNEKINKLDTKLDQMIAEKSLFPDSNKRETRKVLKLFNDKKRFFQNFQRRFEQLENEFKALELSQKEINNAKLAKISVLTIEILDLNKEINQEFELMGEEKLIESDENNDKRINELYQQNNYFGKVLLRFKKNYQLRSFVESYEKIMMNKIENRFQIQNLLKQTELLKDELMKNFDELTKLKEQFETSKKCYDKWKNCDICGYQRFDQEFMLQFNEYLTKTKEIGDLEYKRSKIAEKILLSEKYLSYRYSVTWTERNLFSKMIQVVKNTLVYTQQFHEKYVINGSSGQRGGNCGAFEFPGEFQNLIVSKRLGEGGKHGSRLEGIYLNEYSFPLFRNIDQKDEEKNEENMPQQAYDTYKAAFILPVRELYPYFDDILSVFGSLFKAGFNASTLKLSLGNIIKGFINGGILLGIQFAMSPIVAYLSSDWIEGPYIIETGGKAQNGVKNEIHDYKNYLDKIIKTNFQDCKYSEFKEFIEQN